MKNIKIVLAIEENIEDIKIIIRNRCLWFDTNQIIQWDIDDYLCRYNNEYFKRQIMENKLYVATDCGKIIGCMLLKNTDKLWCDDVNAFYIHHLATNVNYKGIGSMLLNFAENEARKENKSFIRLDCFKCNVRLNKYYTDYGFICVGSGQINDYYYNQYEKKV